MWPQTVAKLIFSLYYLFKSVVMHKNSQPARNTEVRHNSHDILNMPNQRFHPDSFFEFAEDENFNNGDLRFMALQLNAVKYSGRSADKWTA